MGIGAFDLRLYSIEIDYFPEMLPLLTLTMATSHQWAKNVVRSFSSLVTEHRTLSDPATSGK
jgi:hypothetical protein